MSHLTDEQVRELTRKINERLNEYQRSMALSRGEVRTAYDVIVAWQQEQLGEQVEEIRSEIKARVAHEVQRQLNEYADRLSGQSIAIHKPPQIEMNSLPRGAAKGRDEQQPNGKDASIEIARNGRHQNGANGDEQAELDALRMDKDEKAAALRTVLTELQIMAVDGRMPTLAEWDAKKPDGVPTASGIIKRHEISWYTLAEYAKLTPNRPGRARRAGTLLASQG